MPDIRVASVSDLVDGELTPFTVQGKFLALLKRGDEIIAMADLCPHAHCFLSEGWLEGGELWCLCHDAKFDVRTGQPLNDVSRWPVEMYNVRVEGGDIFVMLEATKAASAE